MSETTIRNKIIKYLKALDGCWFMKVKGSVYQRRGSPDFIVCYRRTMYGVEVKRPGNTVTPLQDYELEQIERAGGVRAVVESLEQLKEVLHGASRPSSPEMGKA